MKLTAQSKDIILKEFKKVSELMNNTKDPGEKLFYFSATYAMASRVLNIQYDPILIFIHSVLLSTYSNINSFLNNIIGNKHTFYTIPVNYFDILESTLKELTTAIELDDESGIFYSLKEFSVLGYIATGNGNYLYKKGMLKID
ncbi:MAG: hypothetical protein AB7V60_04815 [Candidatus Caldatribacteriota bacterium]